MKYRVLGKTKLKVSEIGFGTWQLANDPGAWKGSNVKESLLCLKKFVELGGNFIDTAWIYGFSEKSPERHPSEELIGKFMKDNGKGNLIIATKIPPKNYHWPASKDSLISEVFPKKHILQCVDDSLKSLNLDQLDLMQFHVWQDNWGSENEWRDTIQEIMQSGKVKFFGISINDYEPTNCLKTLDTGLISTIQFIFNIFHQQPKEKLLPYALAHDIGLIARVPLDEGGLSGKYTLDTVFDEGDLRRSYFKGDRLVELIQRTNQLKRLFKDENYSLANLALQYILAFKSISIIIPGMRRLYQVEDNLKASEAAQLSNKLITEIDKHSWERNFYN